jgi:hypothetical protein
MMGRWTTALVLAASLLAGCAAARPLAEPEPLDLGVTEIDLRRELRPGTRLVQATTMSFEISGPATYLHGVGGSSERHHTPHAS